MRIHKAHVLVIVFGRYWILQLIDLTRRNLTKPPAKRKMLIYSRLPFSFPRHNTSPQQSVCTLMPHWCNCACLSCRALESPTPTPPPHPRSPWHPSALAQMLCSEVAAFQMISAMRNTLHCDALEGKWSAVVAERRVDELKKKLLVSHTSEMALEKPIRF